VNVDLEQVRERLFGELGVRFPAFRVRTGAPIQGYALWVDELPAGKGQLPAGTHFALATSAELEALGVTTPAAADALGRPVCALTPEQAKQLEGRATLRAARELVADHVTSLLRRRAPHFLGVQEVQAALTSLESRSPALVKEALQKVPLPLLTDVLRKLLHEQVGIRNLRAILEALVAPSTEGDAGQLAERCRAALARQLSHQHANGGPLFAYLVDPSVEETLRSRGTGLDPGEAGAILEGVKRLARGGRGVLLSSPDVRRVLRRLLEGAFPDVVVLTFAELDPELQVRPLGRLVPAK
jgi:type III secretion protein V